MPHILVQMFPGRSEEAKAELAKRLHSVTAEVLGCKPEHVSVALKVIDPAKWNETVPLATSEEDIVIGPIYVAE